MKSFAATSVLFLGGLPQALGTKSCAVEYPTTPVTSTTCSGNTATVTLDNAVFGGEAGDHVFELFADETPLGRAMHSIEMHVPTAGSLEIGNLDRDGSYFLRVPGCDEKLAFTATCPVVAEFESKRALTGSSCELEYPASPPVTTICNTNSATAVFSHARFEQSPSFVGSMDFTFDVFVDPFMAGDQPVFSFTDDIPTSPNFNIPGLMRGTDYILKVRGCEETISFSTGCACSTDSDCIYDEICCPTSNVCEDTTATDFDPTACGDPHMTGFHGQKFDFTGEDGQWYNLVSDSSNTHINMRVTSPVPSLPVITYITGLSVMATDAAGIDHSVVITVKDPHSLDSSCPVDTLCLADGSMSVVLDGQEALSAPGTVQLADDVSVAAVDLPGACRSFGFEKYWEAKKLESLLLHGRRLSTVRSMADWILGDPTATNMNECIEYVAGTDMEGGLFTHQSEHASFQIVTPTVTIRLSHGRLHQLPMRDPTDQFDLPDHMTWQMNMGVEHNNFSHDARGILGETFVPTKDAEGNPIMSGMEAIRGQQEDYRVDGPYGTDFAMKAPTPYFVQKASLP